MGEKREKKKFDLFPFRIFAHTQEIKALDRGETISPVTGIFHPTYICNHNCPGCDFSEENAKYKKILKKKDSTHIINEMLSLGVRGIEFSGGGEPLMDKNTAYHIRRLKEKGVESGVLTNGSFFSGDMQDAIVRNSAYVRISLESGSNEVFKIAKGINDDQEFPKIVKNIFTGVNLRGKIGSEIDISIKYTIGAHNHHDMENAVALAIDLGVDSIQFKPYENVDAVMLTKNPLKNLEGKPGTMTKAKKQLEMLKQIYGDDIHIIGNLERSELEKKCWTSPLITLVDALGDVYLCSYYRHRQDTHKIGNLLPNESFKNIWFSDRHKNALENTKIDECNKYGCRFHRYNKIAEEDIIGNKPFTSFM